MSTQFVRFSSQFSRFSMSNQVFGDLEIFSPSFSANQDEGAAVKQALLAMRKDGLGAQTLRTHWVRSRTLPLPQRRVGEFATLKVRKPNLGPPVVPFSPVLGGGFPY